MRQERFGDAGVLGGDEVHGLQHVQRPQRDVAGIADGRGGDVKTGGQPLLQIAQMLRFTGGGARFNVALPLLAFLGSL